MKVAKTGIVLVSILMLASCASINSQQKQELREWQAQNVYVKEKSPGLAAGLNILPGIGDFYNGNVGYGILNLLTWPLSVLWAPIGGASGADEVNYFASKNYVESLEKKQKKIKTDLEEKFLTNQISKNDYIIASKKLNNTVLRDFEKDMSVNDFMRVEAVETPQVEETADREPSSKK